MLEFLKGLFKKIMKILKNVFTDLPMFFSRNTFTGDLNIRKDALAIKDSIKNIILTLFHERPFDPEFGTNVLSGLFENPADFSFYVENTIATALERYEPRIKLRNITSTFEGRTLEILIEFSILNYDVYDQLSFTMDSTRYLKVPPAPLLRNAIWVASMNTTDPAVSTGTFAPESIGNVNYYDYVKPMISVFDAVGNGAYNLSSASDLINGINSPVRFGAITSKLMELPAGKRMIFMKRYQNGPIYENAADRFSNGKQSPWPDVEGSVVSLDCEQIMNALKDNGAEPDYVSMAGEQMWYGPFKFPYGSSTAWTNQVYGITSSPKYNQSWYTSPSFSSIVTDDGNYSFNITNIVNGVAHPQFTKDYLYWNRALTSLNAAFVNKFIGEKIINAFPTAKLSNYGSAIISPDNEAYDQNGHPNMYLGIVGSPAPELYAGITFTAVYGIYNDDSTRIVRTNFSTNTTALVDNTWYHVLRLLQKHRAVKRDTPNLPIQPWIASKYFSENVTGFVSYWMENKVNENLYYELIRHLALTGTELFLYFGSSDNTVDKLNDSCGKLNVVMGDVNSVLGGFTTTALNTERISYNAKYLISGSQSSNGGYVWRVTPKPGVILKDSSGSILVTENGGGIWITTSTSEEPQFEEDYSSNVLVQKRATDIVRRYYHFWSCSGPGVSSYSGWSSISKLLYNGTPEPTYGEASSVGGAGIVRAYDFEFNPINPAQSSPWHNMIYEIFNQSYFSGFRALSIHFPFGSYDESWLLQPLEWLNGSSAYTSITDAEICQARVKGFTGAVKQLLDGNMAPRGRTAINDPCDVHIYLPSSNGWYKYRQKLHTWWDAAGATKAARDTALQNRLNEFVEFILSMKSEQGVLSITFDVSSVCSTPDFIIHSRSMKDYRSDLCELSTWYVITMLELNGIPVNVEARPPLTANRAQAQSKTSDPLPTGVTYGNSGLTAYYGWRNFTSDDNWLWYSDPERALLNGDTSFSGTDFFGQVFLNNGQNQWTHRLQGSVMTLGSRLPWNMGTTVSYGGTAMNLYGYGGAPYLPHHAMSHIYGCADVYMDYLYRSSGDGRWAERRKLKNFSTYAIDPYLMCGHRLVQPGSVAGKYTWWTNSLSFIPVMPIFSPTGFTANASTYNGGFWTDTSQPFFNNSKNWFQQNVMGTTFGKQLSVFRDLCVNNSPPGTPNPPNDARGLTLWGQDIYFINVVDSILRS